MSNKSSAADLISVIVPCHNESPNIAALYRELTTVAGQQPEQFEFVFVDDGSRDNTVEQVAALSEQDSRVRLIELARNFGKEVAVTAGLHQAYGAAAITIDADLQHPPALIPKLIAKWREGHEVVIGVRRADRSYASVVKRLGSGLFYRIMNVISEVEVVPRATDFRLIDRSVIEAFTAFTERNRMTRGLIDWLGFKRAYIEFAPAKRQAGEAGYSFFKLFKLATNSFISMSFIPLKLAGYIGMVIMAVSGPLGLFIFLTKYVLGDPFQLRFSGPAVLAVIILFLVGLVLTSLGLIALYIANIHTEVMNRPLYVLRPSRRPVRRTVPAFLDESGQASATPAPAEPSRHGQPAPAKVDQPAWIDMPSRRARQAQTFGEIRGG